MHDARNDVGGNAVWQKRDTRLGIISPHAKVKRRTTIRKHCLALLSCQQVLTLKDDLFDSRFQGPPVTHVATFKPASDHNSAEASSMDEPLHKRPRLSMFSDQPSDAEFDQDLDIRRHRNDHLLKSRLELIFKKYSHDFTGVGDEIDLVRGDIVVDNGHLEGMENETDTGAAKGKMLLRAMTEAPDAEDSYFDNEGADDVMMSIEEIAENAAISGDDITPMDSDEELFLPVRSETSCCTPPDSRGSQNAPKADPSVAGSDGNSLFEAQERERSASPDSLFEVHISTQPDVDTTRPETTNSFIDTGALDEDVDDDTVMEKFGPQLGQEVLAILNRARNAAAQAHIEPAWRIPTNAIPPRVPRSTSKSKTPTPPTLEPPDVAMIASPEHGRSLWKPTQQRFLNRPKSQSKAKRHIRAESDDPLQEDFQDRRHREQGFDSGGDSEWIEEGEEEKEEGEEEEEPRPKLRGGDDEQLVMMRKGICYYCAKKWASRAGVYKHWGKLARDFKNGITATDDVHDMEYIHRYWSLTTVGSRPARLVVTDFKTMVELHEGAGLSFDEISDCRALRTRKTGAALNDVYDRYRNPPGHANRDADQRQWSTEDFRILNKLAQNPVRDLSTFTLELPNRSHSEIGDKLAEIWLKALQQPGEMAERASYVKQEAGRPLIDPLFVKLEPSDDELFGGR